MAAVTAVAAQIAYRSLLAGPLHPASSRGHPLRAPARTTLRGSGAGDLRSHRGRSACPCSPSSRVGWAWSSAIPEDTSSPTPSPPPSRVSPPTPRDAPRRQALWTSLLCGCAALAVIYALGATWLSVIAGLSPARPWRGRAAFRGLRPHEGRRGGARRRGRRPSHSRLADLRERGARGRG